MSNSFRYVVTAVLLAVIPLGARLGSAPASVRAPMLPGGLSPIADAYAVLIHPDTPFGSTDPNYLLTQGSRGPSGLCRTTYQTLLKFDISALSGDVVTASLTLQNSQSTSVIGAIMGIWGVGDAWDEATVTWNTRPISSDAPLASVSPLPSTGPLVFASTPALVSYINSQRPASGGDGLASFVTGYVDCPLLAAPQVRNASKENTLNLPPLLDVGAAAPPMTPTPIPPTSTPIPY
jgi:hypothetical protein